MEGLGELGYLVGDGFLLVEGDQAVIVEEFHDLAAQPVLLVGVAPEVHVAGVTPDHSNHLNREAGQAFEITPAIPLVSEYSEERSLGLGVKARIVGWPSGAYVFGEAAQGFHKLRPAAFEVVEDRLQALA